MDLVFLYVHTVLIDVRHSRHVKVLATSCIIT